MGQVFPSSLVPIQIFPDPETHEVTLFLFNPAQQGPDGPWVLIFRQDFGLGTDVLEIPYHFPYTSSDNGADNPPATVHSLKIVTKKSNQDIISQQVIPFLVLHKPL